MTRWTIGKKDTSKGRQTALSFFKKLSPVSALKEDPAVIEVYKTAKKGGRAVYLVGGVLRNIALKSPLVPDYDFILEGDIPSFSGLVAGRLHGTSFLLDKETLSYRVVVKPPNVSAPLTLDFSPIKEGDLVCDLKKRDFTINAMAVRVSDLFETERPLIIDPRKGLEDAKKRVLRAASKEVFQEDPLRVLRAIRITQQYGLTMAEDTISLIHESSGLLKKTSAERVRDELILIFLYPGTPESLKFLFSSSAAKAILPGLGNWENIDGYNLLSHALVTVREAEELLKDVSRSKGAIFPALKDHFGGSVGSLKKSVFFKMAAFFHDIGKPYAMTSEDGRLRFIGHDFEGSRIVKNELKGLKFSRKVTGGLSNLIKNHHRVFTMAGLEERTSRSKAHFFRAAEGAGGEWDGAGVDLICLALADARATLGAEDAELLKVANELLDFYYGTYIKKKPKPLLSGNEIMKTFGIPEGRLVGEVIGRISEGVEKGVIRNKKEAIVYIKKWLSRKASGEKFPGESPSR